jgi:hypothetical protein
MHHLGIQTIVRRLLSELCDDLGFCLAPADRTRQQEQVPPSVDSFTDAVFLAEGLDPRLADKQLWRAVRGCVVKYLGEVDFEVLSAHAASSSHREQVIASDRCGCFYCLKIFPPAEIKEWTDNEATALCPICGIDSVLGSRTGVPITTEFLLRMRQYWFDR